MSLRICTRCGTETDTYCPTCTEAWEARPNVETMTAEERATELETWKVCEIEFAKIHQRIEELVGRPVWTHEMADFAYLVHETLTGERPTMEGVLAKLPADKPVAVALRQEER